MLLVISCAFSNKQTKGIILSNHSPRQGASEGVNCDVGPVLNLRPSAEKFEERMTIIIIIERIIIVLSKSKLIYSFELIHSHGLVSGISSLSIFLLMRPENLLLAGLAKSLDLKKCFLSRNMFTNGMCKF